VPVQSVCAQARVGHGDLPRNAVVLEMVLAQLAPGEPVVLDADDCAGLGG
jgi:triacylglycerol lipase